MQNKIIHPSFVLSASCFEECPEVQSVEVVCLGRSNVGKSSFINFFLGKRGLAKSSSTPGKTRLINFYEAIYQEEQGNIPFRIIDLPGFGYAKVSKEQKKLWEKNLIEFLQRRRSIKLFLHLIDSRHPYLAIDSEVRGLLKSLCKGDQRVLEILTKADKIKTQEKSRLIQSGQCLVSTMSCVDRVIPLEILQKKVIDLALGREDD